MVFVPESSTRLVVVVVMVGVVFGLAVSVDVYQCDMCPTVLRYLHFSAHTITSPVLSIVRKDKATGWPDISQYLNFRYQSDSDECH